MSDEIYVNESIDYMSYEGNRFLIVQGILKDVQVESERVQIPREVKEIRRQAFLDAKLLGKMRELVIPETVKKIERLSFAGMAHLERVELDASIVKLEQGMFRNCMELVYIRLPKTLRQIESRVFENCLLLKEVVLPGAWVQMSEDSFLNCVNLKSKRIERAIEEAEYRRKKEEEEMRRARFPYLYAEEKAKEEPPATESPAAEPQAAEPPVANESFAALELLEEALQTEGIKTKKIPEAQFCIYEGVLERCEVYGNSITIPEGVTALADRLFYGKSQLEHIVFPSTLNYIGVQALEGTGWLQREREKNSYVIVNGILISAFYDSMVLEAKLPDTVYRIAPYAFYHSEAQLVIFPESVREVDSCAFVESGVTEIDFSVRADVTVHTPVAVRCNKLREIYIPGKLDRLEENFVVDCPALKRVCLKWAQTVVNNKAFPDNVRIWVL